ncbi:GYDIA family GHMP kinase [Arenibacter sp. GZD96]|uniref:GYDIA family GHMP kinase n=1 Tax=Aurantibrevibacter litoralis TaxID=3106030 RepID=UPI002AFE0DE3|nr:GYDIA family GHMP kinase [Arenibacter sp. GZD-96]MEA1785602.1 GYDIA family GHMP kinase [Arenibacter sp. GZD-96]
MTKSYYSNGKVLLSGEYLVLDGALSLALPTKYGQFLEVETMDAPVLFWKSIDVRGAVWFQWKLDLKMWGERANQIVLPTTSLEAKRTAETLLRILEGVRTLNPQVLDGKKGYNVSTKLTFSRDWGLGSSSTLLYNLAQWAQVNPYELLWNTLGGSGYDIASAQYNHPILYALDNTMPTVTKVAFNPSFKNKLYFVHLNQKQNSAASIVSYKNLVFDKATAISTISELTRAFASCKKVSDFELLITEHEKVVSHILRKEPVKKILFPDYPGAIKSLGAWGGDFVLAVGDDTTPTYFKSKGYDTIIPYSAMVL